MQSRKDYLILFLAFTTVAGGVLAWRQHQELTELRAQLLSRDERADWQKRLKVAEKRRSDLEKELAAKSQPPDGPPIDVSGSTNSGPRRDRRGDFMAMMDKPEMQRLMALQQKARLDARYSALFKALNLSPEQLDKFKNLLVEKSTAMMDVFAAAREQGINPRTNREAFEKLVSESQAEINASILETLGTSAYSQYQQFEETLPERSVVSQLEQRLSYSTSPLTDEQTEQLISLLAATSDSTTNANTQTPPFGGGPGGGPMGGSGMSISDAAIAQASGVLSTSQVEALKQLQQEQQAQAALNATMREQFRQNNSSSSGGSTQSAPPPPPDGG